MLSTRNEQTPVFDAKPYARAGDGPDQVDDWRPPELPYVVGPELRLPIEHTQGIGNKDTPQPTEDTCRMIETLIINGASVMNAKSLAQIPKRRWIDWTNYANEGRYPYTAFMERMRLARAHLEATCTTVIRSTAVHPNPDVAYRGAVKTLEQQFSGKYGPKTRAEVTIKGSVQVDHGSRLLERLLSGRQTDPTPVVEAISTSDGVELLTAASFGVPTEALRVLSDDE